MDPAVTGFGQILWLVGKGIPIGTGGGNTVLKLLLQKPLRPPEFVHVEKTRRLTSSCQELWVALSGG